MPSEQKATLIPAFSLTLRYHPALFYPSTTGSRAFLHLASAKASGAELTAELADEGGDWLVMRQDGLCDLEGRMMLRTPEGTLLYWRSRGYLHREGERLCGRLDMQPYFDTASGPYDHMAKSVYVARGQLADNTAEINVWRLQ